MRQGGGEPPGNEKLKYEPGFRERIYLAKLRAAAGASRARRSALAPWRFVSDIFMRAPERLLVAPQDIRTADPVTADDIYAGYYSFASQIVNVHGASPFLVAPPSPDWEIALAGFGWLRHLRAASSPLATAHAQALTNEWIVHCGKPARTLAWSLPAVSRRLISWLSQSPMILHDADHGFYRKFMRSIGRHVVFLQRELASRSNSEDRLGAATALMFALLCVDAPRSAQRKAIAYLTGELKRQILPDGGHVCRSPQPLLDILLDLLPLRQTFLARNEAPPPELTGAIDRIMPMLRMFQNRGGELALFNGMSRTALDLLSVALVYDDARVQPLSSATASGFQRLEAGETMVICDTGKPPPLEFSSRAHAGVLSFEFSSGVERIVVNCGAPATQSSPMRQVARLSAAHSTLILENTSSCRFAGQEMAESPLAGRIVAGPSHVSVSRSESAGALQVEASHDSYVPVFGFLHKRNWRLEASGARLAGRDELVPAGRVSPQGHALRAEIRFHLHPQLRADLEDGSPSVLLTTSGGQHWRFSVSGGAISIEESIFFASAEGTRASLQIVVAAQAGAFPIDWLFERL